MRRLAVSRAAPCAYAEGMTKWTNLYLELPVWARILVAILGALLIVKVVLPLAVAALLAVLATLLVALFVIVPCALLGFVMWKGLQVLANRERGGHDATA